MKTGVFTIVAKNYLSFARVLMSSVREHNPEFERFIILADRIDGYFDPAAEPFEVICSDLLQIPNSKWFHFKYSIVELSTAVKPYAIGYLVRQFGLDQVIYLDPDTRVYGSLAPLIESLESPNFMVLTPHLTDRLDDGSRPNDTDILRSGTYNLGFIALRSCPDLFRFLQWWQDKLYNNCSVDLAGGFFVDQRWIDLVPGLYEGVVIERSPGYNVAYWNLAHRSVTRTGVEGWLVNGCRLRFFHFSGLELNNPEGLSRHQNRFRLSELPDVAALVRLYIEELRAAGHEITRRWPYAYGYFGNGVRIPDAGRAICLRDPEACAGIEDPFTEESAETLSRIWNLPASGPSDEPVRIRAARQSSEIPDTFGAGLAAIARRARTVLPAKPSSPRAVQTGTGVEPIQETGRRLTELEQSIYSSRPDLQRSLPDPSGKDMPKFLVWLLSWGIVEYGLDERYVAPIRQQWAELLASAGSLRERAWYSVLLQAARVGVRARSRTNGIRMRIGGLRFRAAAKRSASVVLESANHQGVNLYGYTDAETGVGESARLAFLALESVGVPVTTRAIRSSEANAAKPDSSGAAIPPFRTNLLYVNADQTDVASTAIGPMQFVGRRNIGFWAWELEEFPARFRHCFAAYDEIWTPSSFCTSAISRQSSVPVVTIPHCIRPHVPAGFGRTDFGASENDFLFLTAFDVLSVVERKNPLGAIGAFKRAFSDEPCRLIIKVNHAEVNPRAMSEMRECAADHRVTILERTFSRLEMNALVQSCDCLVSLHRSEGFGLVIAEAMSLGKPVVVTAYSGNMDFTRPENSFLVDYRMRRVGPGCLPYDADQYWADPDLDRAAQLMRMVFENRDERQRRGAAARAFIRHHFSPEAIGARMRERLSTVKERRY